MGPVDFGYVKEEDHSVPYLKPIIGFMGIEDFEAVVVKGIKGDYVHSVRKFVIAILALPQFTVVLDLWLSPLRTYMALRNSMYFSPKNVAMDMIQNCILTQVIQWITISIKERRK